MHSFYFVGYETVVMMNCVRAAGEEGFFVLWYSTKPFAVHRWGVVQNVDQVDSHSERIPHITFNHQCQYREPLTGLFKVHTIVDDEVPMPVLVNQLRSYMIWLNPDLQVPALVVDLHYWNRRRNFLPHRNVQLTKRCGIVADVDLAWHKGNEIRLTPFSWRWFLSSGQTEEGGQQQEQWTLLEWEYNMKVIR